MCDCSNLNSLLDPELSDGSGIFIYGSQGVGKYTRVLKTLTSAGTKHVVADCRLLYTRRSLFTSIYHSFFQLLCRHKSDIPIENGNDFIREISSIRQKNDTSICIILRHIEQYKTDGNLIATIFKINELTDFNKSKGIIFPVFISTCLSWDKYFFHGETVLPIIVFCPDFTPDDLKKILMTSDSFKEEINQELKQIYTKLIVDTVSPVTRNLQEIQFIFKRNLPHFLKLAGDLDEGERNTMGLWREFKPFLEGSLKNIYSRVKREYSQMFDLPPALKFFLIACYICSHNNPKSDRKFFVKKVRQVKTRTPDAIKTYSGPKPFTLQRAWAVFYAVIEDRVVFFNSIGLQTIVGTLERHHLLSRSGGDDFDKIKYKCEATFEIVAAISESVGFEVAHYLTDFL